MTFPALPATGAAWAPWGAAVDAAARVAANVGAVWRTSRRPYLLPGLPAAGSSTDITSAWNACVGVNGSANPYDEVVVPPGTYVHSSASTALVYAEPDVRLICDGAVINSTVPRYGGLRIIETADRSYLRGLVHNVVGATARGNGENYDDCPLSIWDAEDVQVDDVVSSGSRDAAVFISGAKRARLTGIVGRDSFADGLHFSNGARDCVALSPRMINNGDDGIAVVSYSNETACENIRVDGGLVVNSKARGLSIVGGIDVVYTAATVKRCRGAGAYVAHEAGDFNTRPVTRARILGADIWDANYDVALDHGSVMLYNNVPGTTMSGVQIVGVNIFNGRHYATIKQGGTNGAFANVEVEATYYGPASPDVYMDGGITSTAVTTTDTPARAGRDLLTGTVHARIYNGAALS